MAVEAASGTHPAPAPGGHDNRSHASKSGLGGFLVGVMLLATGVILIAALVELWPAVTSLTGTSVAKGPMRVRFLFGAFVLSFDADTSLLLLAIIVGALGSFAGAATAYGEHMGAGDFSERWTWWYVFRIPLGVAIGVLVYLAFRGGFLSSSGDTKDANPYGVAALAGLGGLFSRAATSRLEAAFGGSSPSGPSQNTSKQ